MVVYLVKLQLPRVDFHKLLLMCLVHDIGESVTGDIPTFLKTKENCDSEKSAITSIISKFGTNKK